MYRKWLSLQKELGEKRNGTPDQGCFVSCHGNRPWQLTWKHQLDSAGTHGIAPSGGESQETVVTDTFMKQNDDQSRHSRPLKTRGLDSGISMTSGHSSAMDDTDYRLVYSNQLRCICQAQLIDTTPHTMTIKPGKSKTHIKLRAVPSLVEICLRFGSKRSLVKKNGKFLMPPHIKHLFGSNRGVRSIMAATLSWLHIQLVHYEAVLEDMVVEFGKNNLRSHLYCYDTHALIGGPEDHELESGDMDNQMRNHRHMLACLIHTVDLMMPPTQTKGSAGLTDSTRADKLCTIAMIRLHAALKSRYPLLVEHLLEEAFAYMWWGRGDLMRASQAFIDICNHCPTGHLKAQHLNELGRLHSQFGDPHSAAQFYTASAQVPVSNMSQTSVVRVNSEQPDELVTLASLQSRMLIAMSIENSMITPTVCRIAENAWDAVCSVASTHQMAAVAYTESMLQRLGHMQGSYNDILEEAQRKLENLVHSSPRMALHLSWVHALRGNTAESNQLYQDFLMSLPSSARSPPGDVTSNPWQLIGNSTSVSVQNIQMMKILWKRQILQPHIHELIENKKKAYVADSCSCPLNLHMTADGYLTGDMQMNFPPQRAVYLDPYTGQVKYPIIPLHTEPWLSLPKSGDEIFDLSRVVHLLQNNKKVRTNLFYCSSGEHADGDTQNRFICRCAVLQQTGPVGVTATIDLLNLLQNEGKISKPVDSLEVKSCFTFSHSVVLLLSTQADHLSILVIINSADEDKFGCPVIHPPPSPGHVWKFGSSCHDNKQIIHQDDALICGIFSEGEGGIDRRLHLFNVDGQCIAELACTDHVMWLPSCVMGRKLFGIDGKENRILCWMDGEIKQSATFQTVLHLAVIDKYLLVLTGAGLHLLDESFQSAGEHMKKTITERFQLNSDNFKQKDTTGLLFPGSFKNLLVSCKDELLAVDGADVCRRFSIFVDQYMFVLDINRDSMASPTLRMASPTFRMASPTLRMASPTLRMASPTLRMCAEVPGLPQEAVSVGNAGVMVLTKIPQVTSRCHLIHYSHHGDIVQMLPFLTAVRPSSLYVTVLPKNSDLNKMNKDLGQAGYYVYLDNGCGALISVCVPNEE